MLKKALLWDENRNQNEHTTGFLQFYVKTKKVCRCFASFSPEQEHFTHGMYMTALIRSSDVKKIEPIMFYEGINTKVFERSFAFAIAVVVTSRSSFFKLLRIIASFSILNIYVILTLMGIYISNVTSK